MWRDHVHDVSSCPVRINHIGKFTVWTGHGTERKEQVGGMESCLSKGQGYEQPPTPSPGHAPAVAPRSRTMAP